MTTSSQQLAKTMTVTTADDLAHFWAALMGDGGFGRRTLWLVFLDDDGRPVPAIVPIDDIPQDPTPADVGSFRELFSHLGGYGTPVLLLSRPGTGAVQEHDRQWAHALAALAPRWPVHLATENAFGRCVVTPLSAGGDGPAPVGR